jgi:hypothetical protein
MSAAQVMRFVSGMMLCGQWRLVVRQAPPEGSQMWCGDGDEVHGLHLIKQTQHVQLSSCIPAGSGRPAGS